MFHVKHLRRPFDLYDSEMVKALASAKSSEHRSPAFTLCLEAQYHFIFSQLLASLSI